MVLKSVLVINGSAASVMCDINDVILVMQTGSLSMCSPPLMQCKLEVTPAASQHSTRLAVQIMDEWILVILGSKDR